MPTHTTVIFAAGCSALGLVTQLASCTTPAKLYCDDNAQCENTAAPFCDVRGEFGDGEPNTCVAFPFDAGSELVTVTVALEGNGTGQITATPGELSCTDRSCTIEVAPGTALTLSATAAPGDSFVTWGGGCSGFGDCSLDAESDTAVTASFEPGGEVLWTATAELSLPADGNESRILPADIAVDSQDALVVVGHLVGTPDFGGGPLVSGDPDFGSTEVFAAKFDSAGAHLWSHAFSGTGFSDDSAHSVAITSADEVVLVGKFEDSLTFAGPSDALDGSVNDMFLARLAADGSHESSLGIAGRGNATIAMNSEDDFMVTVDSLRFSWFETVGQSIRSLLPSPPSGTVNASSVDGFGRAVVVGAVSERVDFDPGTAGGEVGTDGSTESYVAKLNWDGSFHSSRLIGVEAVHCVVADPAGDGSYFVVGSLSEEVDLQGGGGGIIVPTGTRNGFVAKYSNTHSYLWSVHLPSTEVSTVTACALGPRGDLVVGGSFTEDVKLSPEAPLTSGPGTFVAAYDASSGELRWGTFGSGTGEVVALASDSVGRTAAVLQYTTTNFTIDGRIFPAGSGVPNLIVLQHAP